MVASRRLFHVIPVFLLQDQFADPGRVLRPGLGPGRDGQDQREQQDNESFHNEFLLNTIPCKKNKGRTGKKFGRAWKKFGRSAQMVAGNKAANVEF